MFLIIPALVALSFIFLFAGLAMAPQPTPVQSRLRTYGTTQPRTLREIEMAEPFSERVILPIIRAISALLTRLAPQRNIEEVRHKLDMAGNPNDWTAADFYGVRGLAAIVLCGLLLLPAFLLNAPMLELVLFGGVGLVMGFILPNF